MLDSLPSELRVGAFSVRTAAAFDVPVSRLRRRGLQAPYRGVRFAGADLTFEDLVLAYAERMPVGHVFSHLTAARWWGMRLPRRVLGDVLDVTAFDPSRAPRVRGVRGHHATTLTAQLVRGIPVSSPAETWRMLAEVLSVDELIIAGDGLVARRRPLCALDELWNVVRSHPGARGISRARAAVPEIRPGTDSAAETPLRLLLVRSGLPEPLVNASIGTASRPRFGDLVYPDQQVVVEYEGEHHERDRNAYLSDIDRFEQLFDWRFVRVTKEHMRDPAAVVARVCRAMGIEVPVIAFRQRK